MVYGLYGLTEGEILDDLKEKILKSASVSNKEVLMYTYMNGHIPKHATDLLKLMKKEKKLDYGKSPFLNYTNVFRKKNIVLYYTIN